MHVTQISQSICKLTHEHANPSPYRSLSYKVSGILAAYIVCTYILCTHYALYIVYGACKRKRVELGKMTGKKAKKISWSLTREIKSQLTQMYWHKYSYIHFIK